MTFGDTISLFAGTGGLDLGAAQVGSTIASAVEINADACRTLKKNFHSELTSVVRDDITTVSAEEILERGGFPCASGWGETLLLNSFPLRGARSETPAREPSCWRTSTP